MLEKGRMFVGLSDRQGMKTCQNSLPLPVAVSAGKLDCIHLVGPVAVWRGIPLNPQE